MIHSSHQVYNHLMTREFDTIEYITDRANEERTITITSNHCIILKKILVS